MNKDNGPVTVSVVTIDGRHDVTSFTAPTFMLALKIIHNPSIMMGDGETESMLRILQEIDETGATTLVSRSRGLMFHIKDNRTD